MQPCIYSQPIQLEEFQLDPSTINCIFIIVILWDAPPPSTHHKDYYNFSTLCLPRCRFDSQGQGQFGHFVQFDYGQPGVPNIPLIEVIYDS